MKAYERYKDSCVAWLGKIPEHWEMRRLKNCIISREAGAWGIDEQNNRNDIICLRVADFDYQNFIFKNNAKFTIRNYDTATIKKLLLANGDILIEKSGGGEKTPVGRAVIFDKNYKAVFANFIEKICTRHDIFSKYFLYAWSAFYESRYVTKYIKQTTGIQNLDITSLFILENFSLPPLSEQNQIAKFLDEKISKINKLISIRQQEISELRELKKAIINKAVTKGDWKRVRLKNIIVNRDGGAWGDEPCNGANDRVCMRVADFDFHNGRLKKRNIYTIRSYSNLQINQLILKYGDILVEKSGGGDRTPVGRAVMFDLDCPALFANFMDRLRVNKNFITPKFFEYCWMSMYFLGTTTHYIKQTTGIQNLDITVLLSRELIPLPPFAEQNEIADYLDKKCSQIDALITNHEKQITELNELKARLISDAVTGKIDVR